MLDEVGNIGGAFGGGLGRIGIAGGIFVSGNAAAVGGEAGFDDVGIHPFVGFRMAVCEGKCADVAVIGGKQVFGAEAAGEAYRAGNGEAAGVVTAGVRLFHEDHAIGDSFDG